MGAQRPRRRDSAAAARRLRHPVEERVARGRRDQAVEYFLTAAVGLPGEFVAPMRETPMWPRMEEVAHTLAYDGRIVEGFRLPPGLESVVIAALVMAGGQAPWMRSGAEALARALPNGAFRLLGGQGHDVAPEAVGPVLAEFLG